VPSCLIDPALPHTWESLSIISEQRKLDKIELAREILRAHEGIPLFEIRFGKPGTEYRCRGSHAVTDKSTASSNQAKGRRHPGNELTSSRFVESEKRCHRLGRRLFVEEIGGVKLHPHGGLISRRGTDILPQIFLRPPTLPGKFCWIMRFGALGVPASPFFNGYSPLLARFSLILGGFYSLFMIHLWTC